MDIPGPLPAILVCPITKSPLRRDGDFLVSSVGNLKYPIRQDIPILLPAAAILPPPFTSLAEFTASLHLAGSTKPPV